MRLLLKFNLVFIVVFLAGLAASAYVSRELLQQNAQQEILEHARLTMEKAIAVRSYTQEQIQPQYAPLPQRHTISGMTTKVCTRLIASQPHSGSLVNTFQKNSGQARMKPNERQYSRP